MKIELLILSSIFCIICCNDKLNLKKQNIRKYHELIQGAEKHILCERYNEAEIFYSQSWQYRKESFGKDIYNRMVCNHALNNKEAIFSLARQLVIQTGLSLDKFKSSYSYLLLYPNLWAEFKEWHPSGILEHMKNINLPLSDICRSIQESDQEYRKTEDRYTTLLSKNNEADSLNIRRLITMISNNGYPIESEIGVVTATSKRKGFQDVLYISILHAYQQANKSWNIEGNKNLVDSLDILLLKAVHDGELHPDLYSMFQYGRQKHSGKMGLSNLFEPPVTRINENTYIRPLNYDILDSLNQLRSSIYLSSIQFSYAKSVFMAKSNLNFDLLEQGCCITYHLNDPEKANFTARTLGLIQANLNDESLFPDICN